jgi:hypothetical protein
MPQKHVLLPRETALLLQIALLKRDMGLLQARLLQQEQAALVQQTELRHTQTVAELLLPYMDQLPVPVEACTFDAEQGALVYEVSCPENPPGGTK